MFYLATVHQNLYQDPSTSLTSQQWEYRAQTHSNISSTATTARTSLSSTETEELVDLAPCQEVIETAEAASLAQNVSLSPVKDRGVVYPVWPMGSAPEKKRSSDSLSRENFLSDILWCGGGDESDEVFSIENLENGQQEKLGSATAVGGKASAIDTENEARKLKEKVLPDDKKAGIKTEETRGKQVSPPWVFHQRSKSNVEDGSNWVGHGDTANCSIRTELTREFGSDESLLTSPTKVSLKLMCFPSYFMLTYCVINNLPTGI